MKKKTFHDETISVMGGYEKEVAAQYNSFAPPLFQTVSYPLKNGEEGSRIFDPDDPYTNYVYTRRDNPTNHILEERIAQIEGGEAGLATSSGMAATFQIANFLLGSGAECVISNRVYARTFELFTKTFAGYGVKVHVVKDPNDFDEWLARINKNTRLLYVETPSNPGLVITDIRKLAEIGRAKGVPLIVDNTLASPIATKPLLLGAAAVVESVSKYICGNGSVLAGAIATKKEWVDQMRQGQYLQCGTTPSPFNSWLCLLGMETLCLRMTRHSENTLRVAQYLEAHPKVARVNYPGLNSHPQHELARRQMNGLYGGVLSFCLKDESLHAAYRAMDSCRIITQAIHESATRSIICHPSSTIFRSLSDQERTEAQIPRGLIRLSIGIENGDDLLEDLEDALTHV
jgi:cystathionine beta-lyase/cystathionine gamma-synthase